MYNKGDIVRYIEADPDDMDYDDYEDYTPISELIGEKFRIVSRKRGVHEIQSLKDNTIYGDIHSFELESANVSNHLPEWW